MKFRYWGCVEKLQYILLLVRFFHDGGSVVKLELTPLLDPWATKSNDAIILFF